MFCENCGKEHDGSYGSGRFCSKECARSFSSNKNRQKINEKISNTLKNAFKNKLNPHIINCCSCNKEVIVYGSTNHIKCNECKQKEGKGVYKTAGKKICKHCGQEFEKWFAHGKFCNSFKYVKNLAEKFNIELHEGSEEYLKDVQKIKDFVYKLYNDDLLSIPEIEKQYNINRGFYLLKFFDIKPRSFSEANSLAIKTGRLDLTKVHNYQYKSEYHTSWEGKTFFLRSSYEIDFANKLDEQKIPYLVEELKLQYWDSQTNSERTAIPDFYLPETNEIVEIKSTYTFDEQNMKDKFAAYKKFGFKPKLILEKKEINFNI